MVTNKPTLKTLSFVGLLFLLPFYTYSQDLEGWDRYKPKNLLEDFKQGDPFSLSGGVGLNMRYYGSFGGNNRQSPFSWSFNANSNISIYKINMPFSFVFSAQNQTYSHPFNIQGWKENIRNRFVRFGASPYYKWVKVHAGHRSMDFSSLTYSGQTFLGTGLELTPGKFRFSAMYGLIPTSEPRDLSLFEINREVFNRWATTYKVGYGDDNNFLDIILMKAKDREDYFQIDSDSLLIAPQENMVIGLNGKTTLFKKIAVQLEVASSAYSNNTLSPSVSKKNFLHPNFLINKNESTTFTTGVKGGWKYQGKGFNFGMDYQRIAPGYNTMGAYYANDDLQNITANTGWTISKIQLSVNLSAGVQNNNLDNSKPATMQRVIASGNINYAIKNFQTSFTYSNFSNKVDYVLNPELDSLNAVVVTANMGLTASYTIIAKNEGKHSLSFSANNQQVKSPDNTGGIENNNDSQMFTANLSYNNVPKDKGWKWTARANFNQNQLSGTTLNRYGAGLGVSKSFLDNRISLRMDNNYFISTSELINQQALNSQLTMGFKFLKNQNINLKVMMNNRTKTDAGVKDAATELVTSLQYQYRFHAKYEQIKKVFTRKKNRKEPTNEIK